MQVQVDIRFDKLVNIVRALPAGQFKQIKVEIEKETKAESPKIDLEALLLNRPVATKKQLRTIEKNQSIAGKIIIEELNIIK